MYSKRFQYRQGDSFSHSVNLNTADNVAYDLSNSTVWYIVKEDEEDADAASKLWLYWEDGGSSEGITVADPTLGEAQVSRTVGQMNTADLQPGIHFWYLRVQSATGSVYTPDSGILDVLPGIVTLTPP